MKILNNVFLIVVVLIAGTSGFNDMQRDLGYYSTSSLSDCVSCIANSDKKICSNSSYSSTSYCCDSWDTSVTCGGNSIFYNYVCTTDTEISGNARYILCPRDLSICNDQYEFIYPSSSTKTFSSSIFNSSYACKYHLYTLDFAITGYTITATSVSNANLTIYVEERSEGTYTFKETLSSPGSTFVSVGPLADVFVVATTSSSSAYVNFTATKFPNSSSSTGLSGGVIASIVIGSIVFIGLIVVLCILYQCRKRKTQREQTDAPQNIIADANRARNNNIQTNVSVQRQSQPQPEPTMGQMIPQPQLYDPVYMNRYSGQPPLAAFYDQSVPSYPQMDPNTKFQPQVKINPTPMAPESAIQPQIIVQSNSQVPSTTQTRNQVTYFNT